MTRWMGGSRAALVAAVLFGAATPFSKLLLGPFDPWLLAGVLYLGSGVGLAMLRLVTGGRGAGRDRRGSGAELNFVLRC